MKLFCSLVCAKSQYKMFNASKWKSTRKTGHQPKRKTAYTLHCNALFIWIVILIHVYWKKRVWEIRRLKLHIYFWQFFFLFICINYAPIVSRQGQRIYLFDVCINLMLIKIACDLISLNRKLPPRNRMTNRTKIARFQFNA